MPQSLGVKEMDDVYPRDDTQSRCHSEVEPSKKITPNANCHSIIPTLRTTR